MTSLRGLCLIVCACFLACPAIGQDASPEAEIRATALDYIEGWYDGDAERMARALHPELAKRVVISDPAGDGSRIDQMSAMTLIESTRAQYGTETPIEGRRKDIAILDIYGNAASVRIHASGWVDYLHMAKWNGQWKIVNVLYELHPRRP